RTQGLKSGATFRPCDVADGLDLKDDSALSLGAFMGLHHLLKLGKSRIHGNPPDGSGLWKLSEDGLGALLILLGGAPGVIAAATKTRQVSVTKCLVIDIVESFRVCHLLATVRRSAKMLVWTSMFLISGDTTVVPISAGWPRCGRLVLLLDRGKALPCSRVG